ncbi:MAG: L-threonylcarbamoyladenylate synthase [Defluviitaleaceae bacterium]|nr:L-threonylcarbamoyladenylate synthase [Defluviitaleaceae bacterium]
MQINEKKACFATSPQGADAKQAISIAADIISKGGIAAFPTETVYGLGADAANPTAVARIYEAKGRPGDNPLILHVANANDFGKLAANPPAYADALIKAFWPGPLTLVAAKNPSLPDWVGGHPKNIATTIGIRMPSHPMALDLIKATGCYVAAPSANKAGTPSPTCAQHVELDFADGSIDYVLNGGAVPGGLESTVVDVTGDVPVILRPGAITGEMIAQATGLSPIISAEHHDKTAATPRAPGMKYRHYAPKAPMTLLVGEEKGIAAYIKTQLNESPGRKIGVLVTAQTRSQLEAYNHADLTAKPEYITLGDKTSPETIAKNLYASLRQFDILGVDEIYAEGHAQDGLGIAIMDRMKKAAEGRIIHVPN